MQRILFLAASLLLGTCVTAQKIHFNQSFGLGTTIGNVSGVAGYSDSAGAPVIAQYTLRLKQYGIVYAPRVDLFDSKDFSISIAAPLMLGFSTTNRYRSVNVYTTRKDTIEGLRGTSLAFEVPLFADINIGLHSASDESKRRFGVYAGVGYTYAFTQMKTTAGKVDYSLWEPALRLGIRMGKTWENRWSIVFNLRGKFTAGAQKMYGLQILKEL